MTTISPHVSKNRGIIPERAMFFSVKKIYNIFRRLFGKLRGKHIQSTCFESHQLQFMFLSH